MNDSGYISISDFLVAQLNSGSLSDDVDKIIISQRLSTAAADSSKILDPIITENIGKTLGYEVHFGQICL